MRGKPADCLIAMNIAERLGEDAMSVMQSIYFVAGKAGWSASYMIARINSSGLIRGRVTWDVAGKGKDLEVTAKATLADTGDVVTATTSMQMAMAEGWVSNKKYQSMPEVMLRYRSAALLQRLYFPEVMLGMKTAEELEDEPSGPPPMVDVTPPRSASAMLAEFAAPSQPTAMQESSDLPPDGPNVFDIDDEAAVANLENRTGIKREDQVGEAADNEFDAQEYLNHSIEMLASFTTIDEVGGANSEVKATLKNHPDLLGQWNSARFSRLASMQPTKGVKRT